MLILIIFAVLAGAGTALSPCVLPVLPALLSATAVGGRRRPLGVVVGLMVTFTITIVGIASVVGGVGLGSDPLRNFAVVVLLVMGLALIVPGLADRIEARLSGALGGRVGGPDLPRGRVRVGPGRRSRARVRIHALRRSDPGGGHLRQRGVRAHDRGGDRLLAGLGALCCWPWRSAAASCSTACAVPVAVLRWGACSARSW